MSRLGLALYRVSMDVRSEAAKCIRSPYLHEVDSLEWPPTEFGGHAGKDKLGLATNGHDYNCAKSMVILNMLLLNKYCYP